MSNQMAQLQEATIKAQCKSLRMPMIASQFGSLAEQAIREKKSHIGYLEALLLAEIEERERNTIERRIREAAAHVDLERLAISPQCGFATSVVGNAITTDDQRAKLEVLARTAERIWT